MNINEKNTSKKIIRLINATNKANIVDLQLFMALILIRFDNLNKDSEETLYQQTIDLYTELKKNVAITSLLNKKY